MKRFKDKVGRSKRHGPVVLKTVDGIEVIHWPRNKTIRYVATHKNPRIDVTFENPSKIDEAVQKVKNKLMDLAVAKLKKSPNYYHGVVNDYTYFGISTRGVGQCP